jgi:amino acid permease
VVIPVSEPEKTEIANGATKTPQRSRNVAIAWGLVILIVLFYLITIFKMGGNVLKRTMG